MGQDYAQRKQAKKRWKKLGKATAEFSLEDKGAKRERKKKKIRRLCQGMCYKTPELTPEDKKWNGKVESDEDSQPEVDSDVDMASDGHDERRDSHAAATTSAPAAAQADGDAAEKKLSRRQKLRQKKREAERLAKGTTAEKAPAPVPGTVKLSTGVQLLDPELASKQAGATAKARAQTKSGAADGDGPTLVPATALAPYPSLVRSFMMSQGFAEPTPIQEACWPLACDGKDVLGVAEPGSGKTLAYLLPLAVRLRAQGHSNDSQPTVPPAVVLAPTRELAQQIAAAARLLRKETGLRCVCLYGGVPKEPQVELLSKHPHIVVATPGRLLDLLDDGALRLHPARSTQQGGGGADTGVAAAEGVSVVVLDEADKMLSLGFEPQLQRLRDLLLPAQTPADQAPQAAKIGGKKRAAQSGSGHTGGSAAAPRPQVLLFTATMPESVEEAASRWLLPGCERVTTTHSAASISKTVVQVVQVCAEHKKPAKLLKHLANIKSKSAAMRNPPRVLVFANKIKTVRFLHDVVSKEGFRCVMLHGQRSQTEREEAMRDFRSGKAQVMVATDVAARGLDVRLLPYVVNYDFPSSMATYIHRVGRTGRLAAYGHAFSFFTRNLACLATPLIDLLSQHSQSLDPNLVQLAETWKEAEARLGPEGLKKAAQKLAEAEARAAAEAGAEGGSDGDDDEGDAVGGGAAEDHDADARLEAEDLLEGLRGSASDRKHKKKQRVEEAAGNGRQGSGAFQERLQKAKQAGKVAAQAEAETAAAAAPIKPFVPSKKFAGARPGYVFKMGSQGLGYYLDKPPKVLGRATLHQMVAKGKGPIVPIGPQSSKKRKDRSRFDSSSEDESEEPVGGDGSGSDSDREVGRPAKVHKTAEVKTNAGGQAGKDGKKKPLGGRLRKKLAKQRALGQQS